MIIQWLGLSCFKITDNGYSLIIDPFSGVRGYADIKETANFVLISHSHRDHSYIEGVRIIPNAGSPFNIKTLESFHDSEGGSMRGKNKIHIIKTGAFTAVHLGDLGHIPDPGTIKEIYGCDILMIPVGGHYTIDADTAKTTADKISPTMIIPMHYREGDAGHAVIGTVSEFTGLYPKEAVQYIDSDSIEVGKFKGVTVLRK